MEIDFLIQWKKNGSGQTNLVTKVKEMIGNLFENTTYDSFDYNVGDKTVYNINYKCSERDNKAYLKITSDYSDAKSARLLSDIRDTICKGEHRKAFLIICTYDDASLSYCCRLMKTLGSFERHLRELMYHIVVKACGMDWVKNTFPQEMINKIKENSHGKITDQNLSELAFEWLDYGQIIDYLFSERYFNCTAEQVLEKKLSDEQLIKLSKEEIVSIISNNRKNTLWNKLFFKEDKIKGLDKETLNQIREHRNSVMHHHALDEIKYKEIKTLVKRADNSIIQAIDAIEYRIYTRKDISFISSSLKNAFSGILEYYNNLLSNIDWTATANSISESFKRISEIVLKYKSTNYEMLGNALKNAFMSLPDYSKLGRLEFNFPKDIDTSIVKGLPSGEEDNKNVTEANEDNSEENSDK